MSTSVSSKKSPAPKKATKAQVPASHPPYQEMVKAAIASLKERNGSSRQAILKYILANYKVGDNLKMVTSRLCLALRRGVASEFLKQKEGHTGPGGRYKLSDAAKKAPAKPKKTTPKKKPAAKKATKAAEGETTETENKAPAKPKAKKSPKKATSTKPKSSPKKAATKDSKAAPKKAATKKPKSSPKKAAAKPAPKKAKSSPKKAGAKPKPKKSPKKKAAAK